MASNFNNDPLDPPGQDPPNQNPPNQNPPDQNLPADTPAAVEPPTQSTGFVRFNSCRWQQPAEEGNAAFCTHREVKPYAGTTGFDPDAWCVDCQYYKVRRVPKKRNPDEYRY